MSHTPDPQTHGNSAAAADPAGATRPGAAASSEASDDASSERIALIGASGNAGSALLAELSARGYAVTAIARHPERIARLPGVTPVAGDAGDVDALSRSIAGHAAVISALRFADSRPEALIGAVRAAGVRRYLVVGGAASLTGPDGTRVFDSPGFPAAYRTEAAGGIAFLDALRAVDDIDWTFVSPSAEFVEGPRTGRFRIGGDQLLADADGRSWIGFADYAIALVDVLAQDAHLRERITVGY